MYQKERGFLSPLTGGLPPSGAKGANIMSLLGYRLPTHRLIGSVVA